MSKTNTLYHRTSDLTIKRFKEYCNENGLKIGFTLDKIINEWLDKKDNEL